MLSLIFTAIICLVIGFAAGAHLMRPYSRPRVELDETEQGL